MSKKVKEIKIKTKSSKRKAKEVESDFPKKKEKKMIEEKSSENKEEIKENRVALYNKDFIKEDDDSVESVEKIERFEPGYSANTLSSYNNFVCHLGDWKIPLKNYLSHPQFRSIFDFVKHEYDTVKVFVVTP